MTTQEKTKENYERFLRDLEQLAQSAVNLNTAGIGEGLVDELGTIVSQIINLKRKARFIGGRGGMARVCPKCKAEGYPPCSYCGEP